VIDAVTPIIQQQNHNALQVASYPILLFKRLAGGRPCTCSMAVPTSHSAPQYDEEGRASNAVVDSIINQAKFGIEDYNPEMLGTNLSTQQNVAPTPNIGYGPVVVPEEEGDLVSETSLNAFNAGACPVCFGTGFVGGYHFVQGQRWVFDALMISDSDGVEVDRSTGPYTMRFTHDQAYVSFRVLAPAPYSPRLLPKISLFDNFTPVSFNSGPVRLGVTHDNPAVAPYDLGPSPLAEAGWITLTIRASDLQSPDLTHVEVTLPLANRPLFVDIPNTQFTFDAARVQQIPSTTVTLPPTAPALMPFDVLCDLKSGTHWMVTSARAVHPSSGQVWSQEADVRPLEPHEPLSALPLPELGWQGYYLNTPISNAYQPTVRKGGF
jgi:hypothetical protein